MKYNVTTRGARDCPACAWDPQLWGDCPQCEGAMLREASTPMREPALEMKLGAWVKSEGGLYLKLRCISLAGYPDRTIILNHGLDFLAELKDGITGELSPRQMVVIPMLRRLGKIVFVIDTLEELEKAKKVIKEKQICEQKKTSGLTSGSV